MSTDTVPVIYKQLAYDETMELIKKAQAGDKEAVDILVRHNTSLVWKAVHRFKHRVRGYEVDDLFQVGCLALVKVIYMFDTTMGVQFSTYALSMISGYIQTFIRTNTRIKVPRAVKNLAYKLRKQGLMDKEPEEIATILRIEDMRLINTTLEYLHNYRVASFEKVIYKGNGGRTVMLKDKIATSTKSDTNWFDYMVLNEAIDKLNKRERYIIYSRYFKEKSQTEVAEELGISQPHMSRLEARILKKLKALIS